MVLTIKEFREIYEITVPNLRKVFQESIGVKFALKDEVIITEDEVDEIKNLYTENTPQTRKLLDVIFGKIKIGDIVWYYGDKPTLGKVINITNGDTYHLDAYGDITTYTNCISANLRHATDVEIAFGNKEKGTPCLVKNFHGERWQIGFVGKHGHFSMSPDGQPPYISWEVAIECPELSKYFK